MPKPEKHIKSPEGSIEIFYIALKDEEPYAIDWIYKGSDLIKSDHGFICPARIVYAAAIEKDKLGEVMTFSFKTKDQVAKFILAQKELGVLKQSSLENTKLEDTYAGNHTVKYNKRDVYDGKDFSDLAKMIMSEESLEMFKDYMATIRKIVSRNLPDKDLGWDKS